MSSAWLQWAVHAWQQLTLVDVNEYNLALSYINSLSVPAYASVYMYDSMFDVAFLRRNVLYRKLFCMAKYRPILPFCADVHVIVY